ncbi:hypothetical protein FACS1894181_16820 [Bacteroidia bacterium]|nr:hypothetical protein FACS1894181_16820 [Bacteroidia bacterium]
MKEGLFMKENRFFAEGDGYIKYSHNNGRIASEPKSAVHFFLHALEKIPSLIDKYEKDNVKLSQDLPVLREIAQSAWRKEDELKALKSELSVLSRKIDLSLKPIDTGKDKPEKRQGSEQPQSPKSELTEAEKAGQEIHALFTGKMKPGDITPIPNRLQEYKEAMGDKPVIASVPKHENDRKGFKL